MANNKRLCVCGCGGSVTSKTEKAHMPNQHITAPGRGGESVATRKRRQVIFIGITTHKLQTIKFKNGELFKGPFPLYYTVKYKQTD